MPAWTQESFGPEGTDRKGCLWVTAFLAWFRFPLLKKEHKAQGREQSKEGAGWSRC